MRQKIPQQINVYVFKKILYFKIDSANMTRVTEPFINIFYFHLNQEHNRCEQKILSEFLLAIYHTIVKIKIYLND